MSLDQLHNVVLLFSNPTWSDGIAVPSTVVRNITAINGRLAYTETESTNLTTISDQYADTTDGIIQGLLYVPELSASQKCYNWTLENLPSNVVHRSDLPDTDYKKVAIAPWVNIDCTKEFLSVAQNDGIRALIFYRPGNSTDKPLPGNNVVWNLNDGFQWKVNNHFPVYAVSSKLGERIIDQLAVYNGPVTSMPNASKIIETYSPREDDYIRVWTQLTVSSKSTLPPIWVFVLISLAIIACVVGCTSLAMHFIQSRRRATLRKRVQNGEVDLEALGIKKLRVPRWHVEKFPLFTYDYNGPGAPPKPSSPRADTFSLGRSSLESSRRSRNTEKAKYPLDYQPTCQLCASNFVNKDTRIREISCGHIFHPNCIDIYLTTMSSLCPLCKACMLPKGYCPPITNGMVRRERQIRKVRERVDVDSDMENGPSTLRHRLPQAPSRVQPRHAAVRVYSSGRAQGRPPSQPQLPTVAETDPPPEYTPGRAPPTADTRSRSPIPCSPASQASLLQASPQPTIRTPPSSSRRSSVSSPTQPFGADFGIELVSNPQHQPQPVAKGPRRSSWELASRRFSATSSTRQRMREFAGPELADERPKNPVVRAFRKVFPGF